MERFAPGSGVVLRDIRRGRVFHAFPVTVVKDADDVVALYLAPTTRWKSNAPQSGDDAQRRETLERMVERIDTLGDREWLRNHVLMLMRPGDAYSPWAMRDKTGSFLGWYVNLQDPFRRTRLGFDTMDRILDIVVTLDGRSWSWKDEDEFQHALEIGLISVQEAESIRAAGEGVIKLVERSECWWTDWQDWAPDESWPIPVLPEGWDVT